MSDFLSVYHIQASKRGTKLGDAEKFQKFLADYR